MTAAMRSATVRCIRLEIETPASAGTSASISRNRSMTPLTVVTRSTD